MIWVFRIKNGFGYQKVDMEKLIAAAPVVSIEEALQGQLGGVWILYCGDPGSRSAIRSGTKYVKCIFRSVDCY